MTGGALTIQSSLDGGTVRVRLAGELDIHAAPEVSEHLADVATQVVDTVVIDVTAVTFLDSSGLRTLLAARNDLQAVGATMALEGVTGTVERVLEATGLRDLLTSAEPEPT